MTSTIREALEDVEIAFLQLEFSLKLLTFAELGKLTPANFDTDHTVRLDDGDLLFPSGNFRDLDSIVRAAKVSVALAFGATALALDTAMQTAGIRPDARSENNVERIRALVYMVRCAYAHGIADPKWKISDRYARTLTVSLDGGALSFDLGGLDGKQFEFSDIGGHLNWFRVRETVSRVIVNKDLAEGAKTS